MTIDKSWTKLGKTTSLGFPKGLQSFCDMAANYVNSDGTIVCPCRDCNNHELQTMDDLKMHIILRGFAPNYKIWSRHGETIPVNQENLVTNVTTDEMVEVLRDLSGSSHELPGDGIGVNKENLVKNVVKDEMVEMADVLNDLTGSNHEPPDDANGVNEGSSQDSMTNSGQYYDELFQYMETEFANPPPGSETKSTNKRGRSRNVKLDNLVAANGGPIPIDFDVSKKTYIAKGRHAKHFTRKIGNLMGPTIRLGRNKWEDVPPEEKAQILENLEESFDLTPWKADPSLWKKIKLGIHRSAAKLFSDRKCRLHGHYKKHGANKKPKHVHADDWKNCIKMWEDPDKKRISEQNTINRSKMKTHGLHGSKPILNHLYDQVDPQTGQLPSHIELYRDLHKWKDERGWVSQEAEENYNKLVAERQKLLEQQMHAASDQLPPGTTPQWTPLDEVALTQKVLGSFPGGHRGVGRKFSERGESSSSADLDPRVMTRDEMQAYMTSVMTSIMGTVVGVCQNYVNAAYNDANQLRSELGKPPRQLPTIQINFPTIPPPPAPMPSQDSSHLQEQ